jgi:hypothetical protein
MELTPEACLSIFLLVLSISSIICMATGVSGRHTVDSKLDHYRGAFGILSLMAKNLTCITRRFFSLYFF